MRRLILMGTIAAAPLVTGACTKPALTPRAPYPVEVTVMCRGDGMQASISPYIAKIPEGDVIEWKLTDSSSVASIDIAKKKKYGSWPYDEGPPYKGTKENPAKAGPMKQGQVDRKFGYTISGTCTTGGETRKIIIDPDMIIIRRTQS
jgi:hypothetical protein